MTPDDPMWDDLWHGAAFETFVTVAREQQGWPDSNAVKKRAYRMYKDALAEKNATKAE
jgi:hypothetical protein